MARTTARTVRRRLAAIALAVTPLVAASAFAQAPAAAPYAITAIDTAHGDREFHLLWPDGAPGAIGSEAGRQAEDHRLPGSRRPGDRRRGRRVPRRRLPGGGGRPRGQADRRVAELARRERLRPAVPPRRALPSPGPAAGRAAGDPHGPQPGEGVARGPEANRDPRLLGGRPPGLDRGHALRRRQARRRRPDRARGLAAGLRRPLLRRHLARGPAGPLGLAPQPAGRPARPRARRAAEQRAAR